MKIGHAGQVGTRMLLGKIFQFGARLGGEMGVGKSFERILLVKLVALHADDNGKSQHHRKNYGFFVARPVKPDFIVEFYAFEILVQNYSLALVGDGNCFNVHDLVFRRVWSFSKYFVCHFLKF